MQAAYELGSRVLADASWDDKQKCAFPLHVHSHALWHHCKLMWHLYSVLQRYMRQQLAWNADLAEIVDVRRAADGSSSYYIHYHDSAQATPVPTWVQRFCSSHHALRSAKYFRAAVFRNAV